MHENKKKKIANFSFSVVQSIKKNPEIYRKDIMSENLIPEDSKTIISEEISKAAEVYNNGGPWITFAKVLAESRDRGEKYDSGGFGHSPSKIKRLTQAYRFLEIYSPETLQMPPETVIADPRSISCLPNLYSRLPPETRDVQILEYLKKVLNKEISSNQLEVLSVSLKKKDFIADMVQSRGKELLPMVPLEQEDIQVLGKGLEFFRETLKTAIKRHGYNTLNKYFAVTCDDLATILNCIADPVFRQSWEERSMLAMGAEPTTTLEDALEGEIE